MKFSNIIPTTITVILVKLLEYASSMNPNLPPDVILRDMFGGFSQVNAWFETPQPESTISNHTDQSELDKFEEELQSSENVLKQLENEVQHRRLRGRGIQKANSRINELKQEVEEKKKEICEKKRKMGIIPELVRNESAGSSSSGTKSSSYGDSSRLDTLRNELKAKKDVIQELSNSMLYGDVRGAAIQRVRKNMAYLQEEEMKLTKEVIEEELRIQQRRNVDSAEVERAYIEQKKHQRILELQQRKAEVETQLEQKIIRKGNKYFSGKKLALELRNIEKELGEYNN